MIKSITNSFPGSVTGAISPKPTVAIVITNFNIIKNYILTNKIKSFMKHQSNWVHVDSNIFNDYEHAR
jgi:hypothetical protein